MADPKTILVVDGADGVRKLIRAILAPEGYTLLEAGSHEEAEAIAELHEGRIDLVVTDLDEPRGNGFAFGRRIEHSRLRVPVLYMSGFSGELLYALGLREDGPNFLPKPFDPEEMLRKTASMVEAA
jgi:DNA-binding response OmpR family regulator